MEKYESKHQQILRSAEQIYTVISRFDNLTPAVQDKVEEWQADENSCSFKVKGFESAPDEIPAAAFQCFVHGGVI